MKPTASHKHVACSVVMTPLTHGDDETIERNADAPLSKFASRMNP